MIIQKTEFTCDLTVLSEEDREQFASVTDTLFAAVQETRELDQIQTPERT